MLLVDFREEVKVDEAILRANLTHVVMRRGSEVCELMKHVFAMCLSYLLAGARNRVMPLAVAPPIRPTRSQPATTLKNAIWAFVI